MLIWKEKGHKTCFRKSTGKTSLMLMEMRLSHSSRNYMKHCLCSLEICLCIKMWFLMLSEDTAMSSVAPFPCHDLLNVCCDDALNNTLNDGDVKNLKKYSIELAQLLVLCQKHNCTQFGVDFCRYLMRKIKMFTSTTGLHQK